MAYGTTNVDTIQSSTANTPVVFKDGNGTQIGTLCRAWVNFNGTGTVAIRASFNVSSITDNGTGNYTVNFTTAMPDANYATVATNGTDGPSSIVEAYSSKTSTAQQITSKNAATNGSYDSSAINVAVFR